MPKMSLANQKLKMARLIERGMRNKISLKNSGFDLDLIKRINLLFRVRFGAAEISNMLRVEAREDNKRQRHPSFWPRSDMDLPMN